VSRNYENTQQPNITRAEHSKPKLNTESKFFIKPPQYLFHFLPVKIGRFWKNIVHKTKDICPAAGCSKISTQSMIVSQGTGFREYKWFILSGIPVSNGPAFTTNWEITDNLFPVLSLINLIQQMNYGSR